MQKILLIQTAFIGDVILATSVLEELHRIFPSAQLDFLLRKGNEKLFDQHPFLNEVLIWDKKQQKRRNLFRLIRQVRGEKYDLVINLQRFFSTGLITTLSKGKRKIGYDKNPFAFFFDTQKPHEIGNGTHEVERHLSLIAEWSTTTLLRPKLYPPKSEKVQKLQAQYPNYICIAPTSVWFTKQFPPAKWVELIQRLPSTKTIFLLGAPSDKTACQAILDASQHPNTHNLAGQLNLLESAALMQRARMNYVNDSAPLHLCSATNAPVLVVFCSTVPSFGFTPLSENSQVIETDEDLACRPCGLHGKRACPEGHFKCSDIDVGRMVI